MDTYLYKYSCPKWWGHTSGLRNINSEQNDSEEKVIEKAKEYENWVNSSKNCNIALLQKYRISIENLKNYSALTNIPMNIAVNMEVDKDVTYNKPEKKKL